MEKPQHSGSSGAVPLDGLTELLNGTAVERSLQWRHRKLTRHFCLWLQVRHLRLHSPENPWGDLRTQRIHQCVVTILALLDLLAEDLGE